MMDSVWFSLFLSLKVAFIATIFVAIFGIAIAYILAKKEFIGKNILDVLCTLPLVLPPTVIGFFLVILLGRNGLIGKPIYELTGWTIIFTWYAAVIASFIVAMPLMIKTVKATIESVDKNYIDAAWTLGYSELQTFFKVILPLSKKGIAAGCILSFARAMGEFGATLMLAGFIPGKTDTMPLAIYSASASGDWTQAGIMVLIFTGISAVVLLVANKLIEKKRWI